jgi:3-deoxy-7-phosphoheptulonate synthase/chorismate mutase
MDPRAPDRLAELRQRIDSLDDQLLDLLSARGALALEVAQEKCFKALPTHAPQREQQLLDRLAARNPGPFTDETLRALFKQVLATSVSLMDGQRQRVLRVSRESRADDLQIAFDRELAIGGPPVLIAGPCAIESWAQLERVARCLVARGVRFVRGGAFKPRSSPYAFQGLGREGLEILSGVARAHGLYAVTEVMDPRQVALVVEHADVLQIGARNMYNYDLLREVGRADKPVLLKRGLSATLEELLWSAEHIVSAGNERVILCERGIRSFERETRNTLDISAVALLRIKSYLPVIVDVSHAAGRKDILLPLARASLAAGAQGLMIEAHPTPQTARSDAQQQLDLDQLEALIDDLGLDQAGERNERGEQNRPPRSQVPGRKRAIGS